jgi:hypothetical protein
MSEWASYSLHDLLIFSPESYYRLYVLSNQAFWPFQLVIIAVTVLMFYLAFAGKARAQLFILTGLACFWLLTGWWFVDQFYSQINTIAHWYLLLFMMQAVFILLYAVISGRKTSRSVPASHAMLGLGSGIAGYALLIHPVLGLLAGRPWPGVELFGIAPDPTAMGTIGFVVALGGSRQRFWLAIIPALWIMISGLTYMTFQGN